MGIFKKIAIAIALMMVLPLVAMVAINAFDEKLTPDATNYGEPKPAQTPDAENGYYALLAVTAPDGVDASAYAQAWVAEARAAAREKRLEKRSTDGRATRPVLCDSSVEACVAKVRVNAAESRTHLTAYNEDLERYEKLIAARRYEEVLDFPLRVTTHFPRYAVVSGAQRAWLLRALLALEDGNLEDAISAIERDFAFQRVMMSGARTLVGRLIAAAHAWRDLALVSDLLQTRGAVLAPFLPRLRAMLAAPEFIINGMSVVVESEFSGMKNVLRDPGANHGDSRDTGLLERVGVRLFYKPNATLNREVTHHLAMAAALKLPLDEGSVALDKMVRAERGLSVWGYINNPVGNILTSIASPSDSGKQAYGRLRQYDAYAFARLVALQVEMAAAGVDAAGAAEFAAKSDARFHDPYTQKPMTWDAATKRLSFAAQGATASAKRFNAAQGRIFVQF